MKKKYEVQLNNLSFKYSLKNYLATAFGVLIYGILGLSIWSWIFINSEKIGTLIPVVFCFFLILMTKLTFIIPRPISTYEIVEVEK